MTTTDSKNNITDETINRCRSLPILNSKSESREFGSLFTGERAAGQHLVIFVRHFFCGVCQDYIRALSTHIPPSALSSVSSSPSPSPTTTITVIGCGGPELIDTYAANTACPYEIYADPSTALYDALGMSRSLDMGARPEYNTSGLVANIAQSIWQGIRAGPVAAMKGGDMRQIGGELLLAEEGRKVVWAHRMKNTRDHAEIGEVRRILGLDGMGASGKDGKDGEEGMGDVGGKE